MSHTKSISDAARLISKQALDGVVTGDEPHINAALRRLKPEELRVLAVDAVILHQYVMIELGSRDIDPNLSEVEAQHPLAGLPLEATDVESVASPHDD